MQRLYNGAFLCNDTAANDPACQMAMASYMEQLRQETARRDRIRAGIEPMVQSTTWHISDRH